MCIYIYIYTYIHIYIYIYVSLPHAVSASAAAVHRGSLGWPTPTREVTRGGFISRRLCVFIKSLFL